MRRQLLALLLPLLLLVGCRTILPPPPQKIAWGYTREHPLPMPSVLTSVEYMDRLRNLDGSTPQWRRVGAEHIPAPIDPEPCGHQTRLDRFRAWLGMERTPGTILDRYELNTPHGVITLWVNPYAGHYPDEPPQNFILAP